MLLFAFFELFDILYPFHRPAVEGEATGLAGKVVQCHAQRRSDLLGRLDGGCGLTALILADQLTGYAALLSQLALRPVLLVPQCNKDVACFPRETTLHNPYHISD